ncbi:MAG: lysophospholipid acyltransferase family protein [Eubacteriales bacterium]
MKDLRFKLTVASSLYYVLYAIPKANKYIKETDKYSDEQCFDLAKDIMNFIRRRSKAATDVYGLENLPADGGYLMYSNHQGRYDALGILLSQPEPCTVLWRSDRAKQLLVKQVSKLIRAETIDPDKLLETARVIHEIEHKVAAGKRCLIFPEGYYSDNKNTLQEFKHGCFKCALGSKVPVIPVAIYDSYKAMNTNKLGKVTTQVHYLKPIFSKEYEGLTTTELAELVKSRIQEKLDEIKNGILPKEKSMVIK